MNKPAWCSYFVCVCPIYSTKKKMNRNDRRQVVPHFFRSAPSNRLTEFICVVLGSILRYLGETP